MVADPDGSPLGPESKHSEWSKHVASALTKDGIVVFFSRHLHSPDSSGLPLVALGGPPPATSAGGPVVAHVAGALHGHDDRERGPADRLAENGLRRGRRHADGVADGAISVAPDRSASVHDRADGRHVAQAPLAGNSLGRDEGRGAFPRAHGGGAGGSPRAVAANQADSPAAAGRSRCDAAAAGPGRRRRHGAVATRQVPHPPDQGARARSAGRAGGHEHRPCDRHPHQPVPPDGRSPRHYRQDQRAGRRPDRLHRRLD